MAGAAGGLRRLDGTVLVPDEALAGGDTWEVVVMEDPVTGAWWGEHPHQPGSALLQLDRSRLLAPTDAYRFALSRVNRVAADVLGCLRERRLARRDDRRPRWARAAARGLAPAIPGRPVVDLLAAARGSVASSGERWEVGAAGTVTVFTESDEDEYGPRAWESTSDCIVDDSPESRRAAVELRHRIQRLDRVDPVRIAHRIAWRSMLARHASVAQVIAHGGSVEPAGTPARGRQATEEDALP